MLFSKKSVVYLSDDEADFEKAKSLLDSAEIEYKEYIAEEMPAVGCGSRINPARFSNPKDIVYYRISIKSEDEIKALTVLKDKVKKIKQS